MTLKVFNETEKVESNLFLRLIEWGDRVDLVACDETGQTINQGFLLTIKKDGVYLHSCVNKNVSNFIRLEYGRKLKVINP